VGRIGQFHADYLRSHKDVGALVITDADQGRAREVSNALGATFVPTAAELIDSVDAVVITSPTSTHADLLHQVVDAMKPTFCEKPIALDLNATKSVVKHVQDAGATVQIGFQRRFDFGYKAARHAVVDGSLGRVYLARMASHDPYPPHEDYLPGSAEFFATCTSMITTS
jgi:myo-inositol 2-dehydrogenase/D-chiro-inositol 1-dehydrogenase